MYQNAGRNCIAGGQWAACNVVEMALWWGIDGGEGGVLARGGWLLTVGWTVNTGFYLFLETAFPVEL